MENNNIRKNKITPIIITALIIIIIGLGVYICYDKGLIQSRKQETEKKEEKQDTKQPEETKETELTNTRIIEELNKKIYFLTNTNSNYKDITLDYNANKANIKNIRTVLLKNGISDDLKLLTALDSLRAENQFEILTEEGRKNEKIASLYQQINGVYDIKQISIDKVKTQYKNYFNEEPKGYKSFDSCENNYPYDSNLGLYFWITPQCGGTAASILYNYKNKYTIKGNEAYVYVSYGISNYNVQTGATDVYKDVNSETLYKQGLTDQEALSFTINETNYQDFSEYKYTFKEDENGNYYFVSIEKTK